MLRAVVAIALLLVLAVGALPIASPGAHAADPALTPVSRAPADYPPEAFRRGISGLAKLRLTLDAAGRVTGVETMLESPEDYGFAEAAAASVRQWAYPAGTERTHVVTMRFDYELPEDYPAEALALPEAPAPMKRAAPHFPVAAGKMGVPGRVVVALTVDAEGKVDDVRTLQEDPADWGFADEALKAVRKWRFAAGQAGIYRTTVIFGESSTPLTLSEAALPRAPKPISRGTIRYPDEALNAGIVGLAELAVTIDDRGTVTNARVANEQPPGYGLGEAAAKAARRYVFPPGAAGIYLLTVHFEIETKSTQVAVDFSKLPLAPEPSSRRSVKYPDEAEDAGVTGWVDLAVQIDRRGKVTHAAVIEESAADLGFGRAAYDSVIKWRFSGATEGAYRVRVELKPETGE